jgi:enoyl-CoA hydratase/carnithine racemase
MSEGRIETRVVEGVGWAIFDNVKRRNAMNVAMWRGLAEAMQAFGADPAVRVVILRGRGPDAFVSGADISEFEAVRNDAAAEAEYEAISGTAFSALELIEKPVIASIHGFCFGGGLAIAMKADLRIAARDAKFSIPAARLGIAYPTNSVRDLVSLVGPAHAKDILFSAKRLDAAEAAAIGLVNRVSEDLAADVAALAATLADNAPLAIKAAKLGVDHFSRGLADRNSEMIQTCFDSADYAEGRRAFMEKRRPVFKGR